MNTVEIKIVINGKEAVATLQLTDEKVQEVAEKLNLLGQKGSTSIDLLRQKAAMLNQLLENATLGSAQFDELAQMSGAANKELAAAEMMTQKMTGTTGSARMALTSFSQGLSDATMFQQDFRMGLMSVRNNIEQFVTQIGMASAAAKDSGASLKDHLLGALKGPGGVLVGITALMALLQILPALFGENSKKVDEFSLKTIQGTRTLSDYAQAIENVQKEFKDLSVDEIKDKFIEIDAQIELSRKRTESNVTSFTGALKAFFNERFNTNFDVTGGEGENAALLEKTRKMGLEEIANRSRVKLLDDEIKDLREDQNKKGSDAKAIADLIEQKERERKNLLQSTNERLAEQAEITIRIQRSQVEAMAEGYEKERQLAIAAFNDKKSGLDEELRTGKITQEQYTSLVDSEGKKRQASFDKIEREKNEFLISTRADALKRMNEMESSAAISRIDLDEKVALSAKNLTEPERLRITQEFALKRIDAEASAQAAIIQIERNALLERQKNTASGSKESAAIQVQLDANDDAFQKLQNDVNQKKLAVAVDFKIGTDSLTPIESIAGKEAEINRLSQQYAQETSAAKRKELQQQIDDHTSALRAMSYSEKQFAQDVYAGAKDVVGQLTQLWGQRVQQEADAKIQQSQQQKDSQEEQLNAQRDASIKKLESDRDEALSSAKTSAEKTAINKKFADDKAKLDKQSDAQKAQIEAQAAARERQIKIDAFNSQKEISRVTAIINIAESVTKALTGAIPPFNFILAGLAAASGAIQLALINESKPALAEGGIFDGAGKVSGPGGPKDDKVNARLSNGEFVTNAEATSINLSALEESNAKRIPIYETKMVRDYILSRFGEDIFSITLKNKYSSGGSFSDISSTSAPEFMVPNLTKLIAPQTTNIQSITSSQNIGDKLDQAVTQLKKMDGIVKAIEDMFIQVDLNAEEITARVEKQQRINSSIKY
ncbi:MAG: hypothetical protein WCW35_14665 [Bacteroidota bacterium]|jgi:hypothetical protein